MKKNAGWLEGLRFLVTGGVCYLVEVFCLVLLGDTCGLDTLLAVPVAFLVSVVLNYFLCVQWVFAGARDQGDAAKAGFLITSAAGLALNELMMLVFRVLFGEDAPILTLFGFTATMYMANKTMATVLVMVWNYFTKRAILKKGVLKKMRRMKEK